MPDSQQFSFEDETQNHPNQYRLRVQELSKFFVKHDLQDLLDMNTINILHLINKPNPVFIISARNHTFHFNHVKNLPHYYQNAN